MQIKTAFAKLALQDDKILDNIQREAEKQSAAALRPLQRTTPRYVYRFVNGIHTILDLWTFRHCEPGLPTEKAALRLLGMA